MRTSILVALGILTALAVGWFAGSTRQPPSSSYLPAVALSPNPAPAPGAVPPARPVVDPDAELDEMLRPSQSASPAPALGPTEAIPPYGGRQGQRVATLDATVEEGSTLTTNPYEVTPGVYNFSTLTPRIGEMEDGTPEVLMDVKRYQFDVSGGYYMDFSNILRVRPDSTSGVSFNEGEQGYTSVFSAELQPGSNQIRIQARDYKTNDTAPSAPPTGFAEEVP